MVLFDHKWWKSLNFDSTSSRIEYNQSKITLAIIKYFDVDGRNTNIAREIKAGLLHFISVSFILSVNPKLLAENSSYNNELDVAAFTAISIGLSCIICGLISNLPFVLAPTTSTSLYFALYLQTHNLSMAQGNLIVFLLGILISLCSIRSISLFLSELIPFVLKVGVCLGVGLLIGLEALVEIGLVKTGEHTVLGVGVLTPEIYIAIASFLIIGISLHHRIRGAFLIGLFFGTMMFWVISDNSANSWPPKNIIVNAGSLTLSLGNIQWNNPRECIYDLFKLVFDLCIICVILLNGLADGLADTAKLKRDDNTLPGGQLIYLSCGIGSIISAYLGVGPIMVSPESAPGIRSGAKTGLSVVVCGLLFLISTIFSPLFASVPPCSTSPILLMIGMMLFENAEKVSWSSVKESLPVFIIMIFIPFTYSLFNGISFGLAVYIVLLIFTDKGYSLQNLMKIIPESIRNRIGNAGRSVSFEPDMSEDGYVHLSGSEPMLSETSYPPWECNDSNILVTLRNRLTDQRGEGDDSDDNESDDPYQAEVDKVGKSLSFTMCEIRNDKSNRRERNLRTGGFPHPLMTPNAAPGVTNDEHEQYMRRKINDDDDEVTL